MSRDYWSRVAWEKEFSHPLDAERLAPVLPCDARVLDLGCGYGRTVAALREAGWRDVVGVDSATGMIARGRAEHPDLDLRLVPDGPLPFEDASFDAVLLFAVLTCIPADDDQRALVREARRVLRPGGVLYVSDLLLQDDARNRARYDARGVFELPEGVVLRHHDPARVDALLAPFERLAWTEPDVTTMNGHTARAFQFLGRRVDRAARMQVRRPKPAGLAPKYGAQWQDDAMATAYACRIRYPDETISFLAALAGGAPARVLDLGAGTGDIARPLAARVARVDALDGSEPMVGRGRELAGGAAPNLRWIVGPAESTPVEGPYDLVVAGESLHWMDWDVVLPRVDSLLTPDGVLAFAKRLDDQAPWFELLRPYAARFSTNREFGPFSLQGELVQRGLFTVHGSRRSALVPFAQTVDDFIECAHSRNGFSRERMDPARAAEFDDLVRAAVTPFARDGVLRWDVGALVRWGR